MNLYIVDEVLYDYTDGMVVIAAENLERVRELYKEKFGYDEDYLFEFDSAIKRKKYKVVEVIGVEEGVVSYVKGGG